MLLRCHAWTATGLMISIAVTLPGVALQIVRPAHPSSTAARTIARTAFLKSDRLLIAQ